MAHDNQSLEARIKIAKKTNTNIPTASLLLSVGINKRAEPANIRISTMNPDKTQASTNPIVAITFKIVVGALKFLAGFFALRCKSR